MLTRQSPSWICRACLSARIQSSQYYRRVQTTSEQGEKNERTPTTISNSETPVRRIPLRELLAARKAEGRDQEPEPLERSPSNNAEINDAKVVEEKSESTTNSESQEPVAKPQEAKPPKIQDQHRKQFSKAPIKKFSMIFHRQKTPNPLAELENSPSSAEVQQSSTTISDSSTSTPPTASDSQTQKNSASTSEPIQSRRQRNLEKIDIPLPSAPTTRLKHRPSFLKRKGPQLLSPLAQSRVKALEVSQTMPNTNIHPADPLNSFTAFPGSAVREVVKEYEVPAELEHRERLWSEDIKMNPIPPSEVRPVPVLEHGLDRVLFNPGVMYLRDPRSLVYNVDPYLENIMPMEEFDYDALYEYITSSRDETLVEMAKTSGATFVGSTSSMTAVLSHFHFLLSTWRPVNIDMLSTQYASQFRSFTAISRAPAGIFLRYKGNGVYAIDADKMYDTEETVLSWLGRSMEKMLTLPPEQMEKFRKSTSHTLEPHERGQPEAYHYTQCGTMLMRSQLDCHDARLPGTGVFDLKTRACISVRMDVKNSEQGADYEIQHRTGVYNSFEREYYDMIRSAFLKYSLQVRIGHMDGIFVAYHNTKRIFGFQYIPLEEMDTAIHGSGEADIGRREFNFSIKLLNETLDRAVRRFPKQSLRLTFETRETKIPQMYVFAEPYEESEIDAIQTGEYIQALRLAEERARANTEKTELAKTGDQPPEETPSEESVSPSEPASEDEEGSSEIDVQKINDPDRELLAMVLRTQNFINGTRVMTPPTPTIHDKWEITYTFETYPPDRAKRLYQMCQERRRKALDEEFREQALEGNENAQKAKEWSRGFLMHLKELSARGKKWREEFEATAGAKDKVVWKQGQPPSRYGNMAWQTNNQETSKESEDQKDTLA